MNFPQIRGDRRVRLRIKIGIDGEASFKNALRDINQAFKVLGSEMTLVSSQFDRNDRSVQALTSRNTVLNKEIEDRTDKGHRGLLFSSYPLSQAGKKEFAGLSYKSRMINLSENTTQYFRFSVDPI